MRLRGLNRNLRRTGNGVIPFSPRRLFSTGEQGTWYDPSDLSTLFQDSAGTVPVTGVDQPVGRMIDKSGRGNHATQATTTSRPILKQDANGNYYLLFDGIDDWLATSSIDFSSTDKINLFAGLRKLSDAAVGVFCETSTIPSNNNGAFSLIAPSGANDRYSFGSRGSIYVSVLRIGYPAPVTSVLTCVGDIASDVCRISVNSSNTGTTTTDQGVGNYGNYPLYIGRRGGISSPFNGHFYGLIIRGALTTSALTTATEKWLASKTGVTL
jgi:hypothetical protein